MTSNRQLKVVIRRRRGEFSRPSDTGLHLTPCEQQRKLIQVKQQLRQLGFLNVAQFNDKLLQRGAYDTSVIGLDERVKLRCVALYQNYLLLKGACKHFLVQTTCERSSKLLSTLRMYRKQFFKHEETVSVFDLTDPEDLLEWKQNYNNQHKPSVAVFDTSAEMNELFRGLRKSSEKFYLLNESKQRVAIT
mmetsp:Transcript_1087/g.1283  ORF Transcript_1087/g.1283 Transcript_1087/m.1283 type:complete len:190 (-) Transcript_1087:266-835(-)